MQLCKYNTDQPLPKVKQIIKELFLSQMIRTFRIQKPKSSSYHKLKQDNQIEHQNTQGKDFVQLNIQPVNTDVKHMIIKKLKTISIDRSSQRRIQQQHSYYLLNFLHKTNQLNVVRRVPPDLSVLETIEEGSYEYVQDIQNIQNPPKRQHPHYSNVILPTQIPPETPQRQIIITPLKAQMGQDKLFPLDSNCVMKIKTVIKFVVAVFKFGNDQFESIAEKIGTSTRNVKLLFDLLTDFFKLEKNLRKIGEARNKSMKKIRKRLRRAFNTHRTDLTSVYIPKEQCYISIREIRELLRNPETDSQSS